MFKEGPFPFRSSRNEQEKQKLYTTSVQIEGDFFFPFLFKEARLGADRQNRVRDVNKFILKDLNRSDDSWRVYTYYYY